MSRLEREAQGVTVEVTEPHPRRVYVRARSHNFNERKIQLSFEEAEGLLWALEKVIKAAQRADGTE